MYNDNLHDYFTYNPDTGEIVRKKMSQGKCRIGVVWRKDGYGYGVVGHDRFAYKAHRLAWYLHTGQIPPKMIDHINRDRADNRWCNLRSANHSTNGFNMKVDARNKSGHTGVFFNSGRNHWWAYINAGGTRHHLGYFKSEADAVAARLAAKQVFHSTLST